MSFNVNDSYFSDNIIEFIKIGSFFFRKRPFFLYNSDNNEQIDVNESAIFPIL